MSTADKSPTSVDRLQAVSGTFAVYAREYAWVASFMVFCYLLLFHTALGACEDLAACGGASAG